MKIYGNSELTRIKVEINKQLDLFTEEVETVNNKYRPDFIKIKKKRSNIIYYIVMTLFLLIFVFMATFLGIVEAFYLVLILFGINLILTGVGVFFLRKVNKKYNQTKKMWENDYNYTLMIKNKITVLYENAKSEVFKVIALTTYNDELEKVKEDKGKYNSLLEEKILIVEEEIKKKLTGTITGESVVEYYNEWADEIIHKDQPKYDFLEARRRKAALSSKNIDIDKGGED